MSKIFYGVNGEGLGHASRTLSVIEHMPEHEIHVFTYGKALSFFQDLGYPFTHEIQGLTFSYKNGHVDYVKSTYRGLKFFATKLKRNIAQIKTLVDEIQPDLFITDYEPTIARVANLTDKQLISIDNQHRFIYCDLSQIPLSLRAYAAMTAKVTKILVPSPDRVVISTFHYDETKADYPHVSLVESMIRKSVAEQTVCNNGFLLVYLRPSVSDPILKALKKINRKIKVYGAAKSEMQEECHTKGNFEFLPLSAGFVKDLAACDRIIATAGNQLLGEARFFRKPILAIPEPMQYEQSINAWYVEQTGLGITCSISDLNEGKIEELLAHESLTFPHMNNGIHKVKSIIDNYL